MKQAKLSVSLLGEDLHLRFNCRIMEGKMCECTYVYCYGICVHVYVYYVCTLCLTLSTAVPSPVASLNTSVHSPCSTQERAGT